MSASHSTDSHDDKSSKQGFLFVNNNVGQRKHNSKTVRSHAARGTGRPRNTTVLRTPRTGLWILPENEIIEMKREVERDLVIGRSMTMFPGLSPSSMNKIFSSFNQLTQALYPTSFCSVFPIAGCAWVTYLNQEPVNNLIFPYLAESFFGGFESAEARRLLARILPLIQANIEDPQKATSDGNISAVLALASASDVSGDLHGLKQHVHGLSSLVSIRGGISKLYHTELQIKCSRVDVQLSLYTGSNPLFFRNDMSWEPFFGLSNVSSTADSLQPPITGCSEQLRTVWDDIREFCKRVNLAQTTGRKIEPRLFQEVMVSLQYRLLYIDRLPDYGITQMTEAIRLGCLAFTTSIFLNVGGIHSRYHNLSFQFKLALEALETPTSTCGWEHRFWLFMVAAISVLRLDINIWLKVPLSKCQSALHITTWSETKLLLKKFLWIDVLHDPIGEAVFEQCRDISDAELTTTVRKIDFQPAAT